MSNLSVFSHDALMMPWDISKVADHKTTVLEHFLNFSEQSSHGRT